MTFEFSLRIRGACRQTHPTVDALLEYRVIELGEIEWLNSQKSFPD